MTTITRDTMPASTSISTPTDPTSGARVAALAGVAFVVLSVASTVAAGSPPAGNASAAKVATYFHDHSGGIRAELLLGGLGIAALMWWFGTVWRLLSRAEHERPRLAMVAAIGLGVGVTLALVNGIAVATAALRGGDPATTRLLYTLSVVAISAAGYGLGTFLLATSVVTYRARITPTWVSGVGILAALAFFASTIGGVTNGHGVVALGFVAFLVWCVWILAVSVTMWRSAES
jgi:hypothetical protein